MVAAGIAAGVDEAHAVDGGVSQCMAPTGIQAQPCQTDFDCQGISAIAFCNKLGVCACPGTTTADMATTNGDGGGGSGGTGGGGGTGGSGGTTGGSMGGAPIIGGGMTFPTRTGCSYVPGQR